MKLFSFMIAVAFYSMNVFASDDATAQKTFLKMVKIRNGSIKIQSSETNGPDWYKINLAFTIEASNGCEANYVGLFSSPSHAGDYTAVYSKESGPCLAVASSREVSHDLNINLNRRAATIFLNGISLTIYKDEQNNIALEETSKTAN